MDIYAGRHWDIGTHACHTSPMFEAVVLLAVRCLRCPLLPLLAFLLLIATRD